MIKLERVKEQEEGRVKFWAEDFGNKILASLIQSSKFEDEMEIRVVSDHDNFEVRGHKSIMNNFSFDDFIGKVLLHIERHESFKEFKN